MSNKKIFTYIGVVAVGFMIATPIYAVGGQGVGGDIGNRNGQNKGGNFVDENENGIPDGSEDFDGDGIINRDDDDYEKQYINMQDSDGDGIANRIDEDYVPVQNGDNRSEELVGERQMIQNREQIEQQETDDIVSDIQTRVTNRNQNRVTNQNDGVFGEKVRAIAREQERLQQEIAQDIATLQKQSGFKRLFMGADKNSMQSAQIRLAKHDERIAQLKTISEATTDLNDKAIIDEQIELMESSGSQLQKQITDSSGGFSFFGWAVNLFN